MSHALAQFSRNIAETSQVRQRLPETGLGEVGYSTVPSRGVWNEGLITQKRKFNVHSHSFQKNRLETLQICQILQGTGRREVYDFNPGGARKE